MRLSSRKLRALSSPVQPSTYLQDLLKCVRCGSCKVYCPTYEEAETETMAARGRLALLREVLLQKLKPSALLNEKIFSCILCGACSSSCPSNVDIIEQFYRARRMLRQSDKARRYIRTLAKFFAKHPYFSFKTAQILQYIIFPSLEKKGVLPKKFTLPENPLKSGPQVFKGPNPHARVALFTGCATNFLYPHLGVSLINILVKAGYEVILQSGEVCCGAPLRTLGLEEEAIELAKKNVRLFQKLKVEAVISLCPTCVLTIKHHYPKMIGKSIRNIIDVSSFLFDKLDLSNSRLDTKSIASAVYHDPCHLAHGLGIKQEPRELLKKIGVDVKEKKEQSCCGFGGVFSLSFNDLSHNMLKKQVDLASQTDSAAIVTACPGCIFHLSKSGRMPAFHIVELVEEAYCRGDAL